MAFLTRIRVPGVLSELYQLVVGQFFSNRWPQEYQVNRCPGIEEVKTPTNQVTSDRATFWFSFLPPSGASCLRKISASISLRRLLSFVVVTITSFDTFDTIRGHRDATGHRTIASGRAGHRGSLGSAAITSINELNAELIL